jgi:WD40 repeat protein
VISGGVTPAPDGDLFALPSTNPQKQKHTDPCVIELRRWEDLSLKKMFPLPGAFGPPQSIDSSPDGQWLVVAAGELMVFLDRDTGEIMSRHMSVGYITGLAFDHTSTFVAGVATHDGGGCLMLWRLTPADLFRPRVRTWQWGDEVPFDEVEGMYALSADHGELDRTGVAWPERDLADAWGTVAFSPDSQIVVFRLISSYNRPFSILWPMKSHRENCSGVSAASQLMGQEVALPLPLMVVLSFFLGRITICPCIIPKMGRCKTTFHLGVTSRSRL